jgi:WhiB family redox-sensing transcriptional regulator
MNHDWLDEATCRGVPIDVFFLEGGRRQGGYQDARAICAKCPVMAECRAWNDEMERGVASTRHIGGFFGGESPEERRARRRDETPPLSKTDLSRLREELVQRYGTGRGAAHAFAERYGIYPASAERLFERARAGEHIGAHNADRLRIFNAS